MLKILLIIAILVVSNTNAGRNRKGRAQPQKTKTINVPEIKLNDGCDIPMVGMGTWQGAVGYSDDTEMARIITDAIETGYRHIDTASIYGTERGTGIAVKEAIAKNRVKRSDMFITSKVWNNMQSRSSVVESIKNSLKVLDMTYLDLALIHYPTGFKEGAGNYPKFANGSIIPRKWDKDSYLEAWKGMEDAFKLGLAKSIGVSNFNTKQLKKLVESAEIKPSVNQVESHPNLNQRHLLNFCRKNNVLMEAYAPIRQADKELLNDPVLKEIAAKHNKTAAQVAFRWQIQRGVIVIPKTSKKSRMLENIDVFDFTISDSDMRKINAMKQKKRIYDIPGNQNHPDYPFNSADFLIDDNNAEEKIYALNKFLIIFVSITTHRLLS